MIADLHCHYPMHLLPHEHDPQDLSERFFKQMRDAFDEVAVGLFAQFFNNPRWDKGWRVDLNGLEQGNARLVCSVLYWPADEFDLSSTPLRRSFQDLRNQLQYVERNLQQLDPAGKRHFIVKRAVDLDDRQRIAFVHCVEGGFLLGPDESAIDANVRWLAKQGVVYITVAHLFFRGVATDAPAIPLLTDAQYNDIFPQDPHVGLTDLGQAVVRAMYKHKVLVDISHMSHQAILDTFGLIEQLDAQSGCDPRDFPVIATHVGMRGANGNSQAYNLDIDTACRIQQRGGVIGVIMAQHQIGSTSNQSQSRAALGRHIDAIAAAGGGDYAGVAIGSDLDGFIKPTLCGIERACDLAELQRWIREDYPGHAEAILSDNARRVIRRVFEVRERLSDDRVSAAPDGFYHPVNEQELVALVKMARSEGRQLRVRGAAHSVSHVVYTDPLADLANQVSCQKPPTGDNVNVMLDLYRGWRVKDESRKLVEADAGIHLGEDPSDPTGTANLESSLLWQLWKEKGLTLSNLGGITHQTVSGFTSTGSSGGSPRYSVNDNLWGFRIIDGSGDTHEFSRDDADPDPFHSMSPSMGLLGVVSTITFECEDAFNIIGQEAITTVEDCAVDLFGPGDAQRPSLEQFLRDAEYARLVWWPQPGADRVLVWQAQRIAPQPGFQPLPYEEFTAHPETAETFISILLSIFGNLDDVSKARPQIKKAFERVEALLDLVPVLKKLGWLGEALAKFLSQGARFGIDAALEVLKPVSHLIEREIPVIFPKLLGFFLPLDSQKKGSEKGRPQRFQDYPWHGLPMDNGADEELLPTAFTEIWLPLKRTEQTMQLLNSYFTEPADVHEAYRRTGLDGWELYSAKSTKLWMSASHSSGADEWEEGAFRIDPYWFGANSGDPVKTFYPQFWQLLRQHHIPFRLHWGKYQPVYRGGDLDWINFFKAQYPRWDAFLGERAKRDPNNIFLTSYWRDRFGLWNEPTPRPTAKNAP